MYAYAHNTTPLSQRKLSPYQIVFHTHPRIPLTFSLNLPRDSLNKCRASYCDSLSPHTHYSNQDLNPFFHSLLDNFSHGFYLLNMQCQNYIQLFIVI